MSSAAANLIAHAQQAYAAHPVLAYAIIYVGTILFGNVIVLSAFLLAWIGKFGYWGIVFTLIVCLAAHLSGDMIWYWAGRFFRNTRFGLWIRDRLPRGDRLEAYIDEHRVLLIAVGKLLATPVVPLLFLSGWYKMKFARYLRVSIISTLIWFPVIVLIAYGLFSGASALGEGSLLATSSAFIAFIVVGFFAAHFIITPRLKKYWK